MVDYCVSCLVMGERTDEAPTGEESAFDAAEAHVGVLKGDGYKVRRIQWVLDLNGDTAIVEVEPAS